MTSSSLTQIAILLIVINVCRTYVVMIEPLDRINEDIPSPGSSLEDGPSSDPAFIRKRKSLLVGLSEHTEEVCKTRIRQNYRPTFGHIANGSRVEIQQDEESYLEATFVECHGENRPACHGVDHNLFISECVTVYEHRPANVRIAKSGGIYFPATVRVPILCECRLRRQFQEFAKRK